MSVYSLAGGWPTFTDVAIRDLGALGQDGNSNHNHYHTRRSWNSDFSYLYLIHNGPLVGGSNTQTCALHHGTTGAWIKDLWTIQTRDWRAVWSKTLPHIIYTTNNSTTLVVHDVVTNAPVTPGGTFIIPYVCSQSGLSLNEAGTRICIPRSTGQVTIYALNANGTIGAQLSSFTASVPNPLYIELGNPRIEYCGSGNRIMYAGSGYAHTGTAQAGTDTQVTLAATASATNDQYKYSLLWIKDGPCIGQSQIITAYNGTTKVATVSPAFTTNVGAVAYDMDRVVCHITEDDGTVVYTHTGIFNGHWGFGFGKLVTMLTAKTNSLPLQIAVRNIDGSGTPLVVYQAGGIGTPKAQACSSIHMTWPQLVSDRFFVSCFPPASTFPYNFNGTWGAYVSPTGTTWNSPNSETNIRCPYDELFLVRTTDNWASQAGIVIRYLGRCLSNGGGSSPLYSFWAEPLVSPRPDGNALLFHTLNPA